MVDGTEECDNGPANSATSYGPDQCTDKCKRAPYCGDGTVNGPEKCDRGRSASTDLGTCNPECSGFYEKKYIRQTQSRYPAVMGGIAGADQNCQAELGSSYKALLVGGSRRATVTPLKGDGQMDWVIRKFTHYYNSMDQFVWRTDDVNLLGVRNGQRLNVYAKVFPESRYPWSGWASDWTTFPDGESSGTCGGWTSAPAEQQGSFCFDDLTNAAGEPCTTSAYLLCVEQ